MALSLTFEAPSTYRLADHDVDVGWLDGDTLAFTGFPTLAAAERAGEAAYVALMRWLTVGEAQAREELAPLHFALGEDGTSEWIGPDGRALARVIRPANDHGYVLELALPAGIATPVAARAALRVYEAIQEARDRPSAPSPGERRRELEA